MCVYVSTKILVHIVQDNETKSSCAQLILGEWQPLSEQTTELGTTE